MDFVDDFIEEYRKNTCLWMTTSPHYKNRTKRQEAYYKLIAVAAKHGEHYNIERTKQKINNLRCAFRNQIKKHTELKMKSGKDELYSPKRKYFESLMFLMEEEKLQNKKLFSTLSKSSNTALLLTDGHYSNTDISQDLITDLDILKQTNIDICSKRKEVILNTCNIQTDIIKNNKNPAYDDHDSPLSETRNEVKCNNFSATIEAYTDNNDEKKRCRRVSISSAVTNESDYFPSKCLKIDCTSNDFHNLLKLACSNVDKSIDDNFANFGKMVAQKLRCLSPPQAIFAEKIITDVLFRGHLGLLCTSNIENFSICQK